MIEVRVTPQRGMGFDKIAERIYNYPEVSLYTLSQADSTHGHTRGQDSARGITVCDR